MEQGSENMNFKGNVCRVEPIRDKQQIEDMKTHLKLNNIRDWLMFTLGINVGLRISDVLKLTVESVSTGLWNRCQFYRVGTLLSI